MRNFRIRLRHSIEIPVIHAASACTLHVLCLIATSGLGAEESSAPVKVYILAGQSNMEGKAKVELLERQLEKPETRGLFAHYEKDGRWVERDDVFIKFLERKGKLTVGYGSPGCVGPELELGHVLGNHHAEPVLLIKTAWGGRSLYRDFRPPSAGLPPRAALDDMLAEARKKKPDATPADIEAPFGASYRAMLEEVRTTLSGLKEHFPELEGRRPELAGFIWFQGWNDMISEEYTAEYTSNLAHFIHDVRRDFATPALPFVVGQMGVDGAQPGDGIRRFKTAQAAILHAPGLEETVSLVRTDVHWDLEAEAVFRKGWREHIDEWNQVGSDWPFHYLGSARTLCAIGRALAEAVITDPAAPWLSGRLEPEWADAKPRRTLRLQHDSTKSDEQNGEALDESLARLVAGDRLKIGPGRYSIARKVDLSLRGTREAPIWIVAADEERPPVITRPDARQNVFNVGESSHAEFIGFRGLELTGGSTLIRFHDSSRIWVDRCHFHHAGHEGITTNTRDTSRFFITRNHFHHFTGPDATGEAMYLGGNHGEAVMSYSVIAENHVHDCGGTQGDGIELKQGSHHNWIVDNHVHDTKYPCILVYGTGGKGINLIERNVCYRSGDNVLQVQGEAIVRNNLLIDGAGAGLASTDHQGKTRRLEVVHNTIVARRRGANLSSWNDREGMLFANNIVCTDGGDALRFPGGSKGVTIAGNVLVGRAGIESGFVAGGGLADFEDVRWDGEKRNAAPLKESPAPGAGDGRFRVDVDLAGRRRSGRIVAGACEVAGEASKAGEGRAGG